MRDSRLLKFRAWDNLEKRMVNDPEGLPLDKGVLKGKYLELMQFTGRKDSVGAEIYEGDILEGKDERLSGGGTAWYARVSKYDGIVKARGVVEYRSPSFYINCENQFNEAVKKCRGKEVDNRLLRGLHLDCGWYADLEVIGNIHETPELLEKKEGK